MLKTGDSSQLKDGGAREAKHQVAKLPKVIRERYSKLHKFAGFNSVCNDQITSLDLQCQVSASGHAATDSNSSNISGPTASGSQYFRIHNVKAEHSMAEEETEIINNQSLLWLKSDVQSDELDMLDMEDKHPSSSLHIMETPSEFSETVNEFVYSTSLPDSENMAKQNVGSSYFEALENGENVNLHMTWSSGQNASATDPQLPVNTDVFVSLSDDALEESVNNVSAISCSTGDLNSTLFENISHDLNKPDPSSAEVLQYSDTLNFPADRSVMCPDESGVSFNTVPSSSSSSSDLKSLQLTLAGTAIDQISLPNLSDNTSDVCLNNLPNFLGLENSVTNVSSNSSFIEGTLVNILEGIAPSLGVGSHVLDSTETLQGQILQDIDTAQLKNNNLSLTTISISKDDENSTKILVDTHQGQQQMYVINTADLNHTHNGNVNQGNIFVINASDLNPGSGGAFSASALEPGLENITMTPQTVTGQPALKTTGIPGKE